MLILISLFLVYDLLLLLSTAAISRKRKSSLQADADNATCLVQESVIEEDPGVSESD